jgi:hypothetical protein
MDMKYMLLLTFLILLAPGENAAQVLSADSSIYNVNLSEGSSIQFIALHVSKENGRDKIALTQTAIHPGRLKKEIDISTTHDSPEKELICSILDGDHNVVLEKFMPYPLVRSFEYTEEGNRQIKSKNISFESADVLIRIPYRETNKFIRIEKYVAEFEREEISTLKIN